MLWTIFSRKSVKHLEDIRFKMYFALPTIFCLLQFLALGIILVFIFSWYETINFSVISLIILLTIPLIISIIFIITIEIMIHDTFVRNYI
ncbi:hypothetical protein [Mesomycoplasma neurolyticum]|nr:hypothetical protein [Mesomycoplasma neurolyticum]